MVEGGSILHADHPRKWVIFARRFTIYPRTPSLDGIRKEVDDYMGEWPIQVIWYEGQ